MNTLKNLLRKGITIGSFCLVSGTILSAQISLSMQNKSTREVIREIEKVSDYRFFYNDNLSGLNTKISVSAQGENIRDVLEQIKSQVQITYIIKENNQIVLSAPGYVSSSTQQNTRKITGIIKEQQMERLRISMDNIRLKWVRTVFWLFPISDILRRKFR